MTNGVVDLTEYMPRGGWITASIPFIFNIDDVTDIQKKVFEFEDSPEQTYVVRLTFKNGDHIDLIYPDARAREAGYSVLATYKAKSRFKVLDGKSGK